MSLKLISIEDLEREFGLSRSTVFRLEKDGRFPKRIKLSDRKAVWQEEAINEWIIDLIKSSESEENSNG